MNIETLIYNITKHINIVNKFVVCDYQNKELTICDSDVWWFTISCFSTPNINLVCGDMTRSYAQALLICFDEIEKYNQENICDHIHDVYSKREI